MNKFSLDAIAREQARRAHNGTSGRSARTVLGGHENRLRQTVIALITGAELAEHESPGEASVLVLHGRVRLRSGDTSWEGRRGDLIVVPDAPHSLAALEDSSVLLTVVKL